MILPIIGLIITPILNLGLVAANHVPIFLDGTFFQVANPSSSSFNPQWALFFIFEIGGNLIFALSAPVLLFLLFKKKRILPKLMIIYYLAHLFFIFADTMGVFLLTDMDFAQAGFEDVGRGCIFTAIWGTYFAVSKRVKNTFVN